MVIGEAIGLFRGGAMVLRWHIAKHKTSYGTWSGFSGHRQRET